MLSTITRIGTPARHRWISVRKRRLSNGLGIVAISRNFLAFEDSIEFEGSEQRCWITLLPFGSTGAWVDFVYGFVTSRQVLAQSAGNQRMIEVAGAIQEGAGAYLKRQYTAITIVGVVVAVLVFLALNGSGTVASGWCG